MANTRSRTINYTMVLGSYNIRRLLLQIAKIAPLILQILWSFRISHKKHQNDSLYSPQITNISTLKHRLPRQLQTAKVSLSPRKRHSSTDNVNNRFRRSGAIHSTYLHTDVLSPKLGSTFA